MASSRFKLEWNDRYSNILFGPHQLSDGTLRFMALAELLLQPENSLPPVILLDEPELGLHPHAIEILCGMLAGASVDCQIVLATQSVELVNQFDPEDIIVVSRQESRSTFERLNPPSLAVWLEDDKLGDLWRKNIIGGNAVQ